MTIKGRFTDEEWEVLLGMPAQLVVGVGMADAEGLDKAEMLEAAERMGTAAVRDPDPLYKEISRDLANSPDPLHRDMLEADSKRCRQILQDKLTADEYQHFLKSVWLDGIAVAKASGGKKRLLREDIPPIDEEEAKLLAGWARLYGLDPTTQL